VDGHGLNGTVAKFLEHDGVDPHADWIIQQLSDKSFADRRVGRQIHSRQAAGADAFTAL
jgi:hypothetical protein